MEIPPGGAEGVLLAQGSRFAGYALYVKDRRLHYVHNYLGMEQYTISSTSELPVGPALLRFEFTRTGEHRGIGALFVGAERVGGGEIPRTVPNIFDITGEGLCCGYDSGVAVTDAYLAPFRFTGTIPQVVVEVDGAAHVDPEATARAEMAAQ